MPEVTEQVDSRAGMKPPECLCGYHYLELPPVSALVGLFDVRPQRHLGFLLQCLILK